MCVWVCYKTVKWYRGCKREVNVSDLSSTVFLMFLIYSLGLLADNTVPIPPERLSGFTVNIYILTCFSASPSSFPKVVVLSHFLDCFWWTVANDEPYLISRHTSTPGRFLMPSFSFGQVGGIPTWRTRCFPN